MGKSEAASVRGLTRRGFMKTSALASMAAVVGGSAAGSLYGCSEPMSDEEAAGEEKVVWNACENCGVVNCPLQYHVVDGQITYVETDTTGGKEFGDIEQRACLRGRSSRWMIQSPDRIIYPMKRVGRRGSGEFERISWDEAIDLFYEHLKHTYDAYGPEAVFCNCAAGSDQLGRSIHKLFNLLGGFLRSYGTDSETQAEFAAGYTFFGMYGDGTSYPAYGSAYGGSPSAAARNADLVVMFGSSAATSKIGGASDYYDFQVARESGARIVWIDARQGEESSGNPDEWLPICPGTDAALALALCYTMLEEGIADLDLIHKTCYGFDDETLPEGMKGKGLSWCDYLFGTGYDMVVKSPEWAAPITKIPAEKIRQLARDICNAKAAYIGNGVGVQRRVNGEQSARCIMMVPIVAGQWGAVGTSTGLKPSSNVYGPWPVGYSAGVNPVKAVIPVTKRIEVVERGHEFTALRDGLLGADKLTTDVKFIYNRATNMLCNQNSDLNWAASVLEDESKCEYIVGSDWFMSASMKYCDLILPETMSAENDVNLTSCQASSNLQAFVFGQKVVDAPGECKAEWDWLVDLARKFDLEEEFTEGTTLTEKQIASMAFYLNNPAYPGFPTYEEGVKLGLWRVDRSDVGSVQFGGNGTAYMLPAFIADPESNPLSTESGKVEVYSQSLEDIGKTWELDDPVHDVITGIPMYVPDFEGVESLTDEYPLQMFSWKSKIRYHSKFDQVPQLRQACRHQIWINPIDAEPRGIKNGDMVRVWNDRGEIRMEARVTPRVIPGAMCMEEGRNREVDENGVDVAGSINSLVSHHWSPLAKHNPSNSIHAQVEKL